MYFEHLFYADPSIIESNIYEVNSTPSSHQGGFYDLWSNKAFTIEKW